MVTSQSLAFWVWLEVGKTLGLLALPAGELCLQLLHGCHLRLCPVSAPTVLLITCMYVCMQLISLRALGVSSVEGLCLTCDQWWVCIFPLPGPGPASRATSTHSPVLREPTLETHRLTTSLVWGFQWLKLKPIFIVSLECVMYLSPSCSLLGLVHILPHLTSCAHLRKH